MYTIVVQTLFNGGIIMDFFLKYKWEILIVCELIAWITTVYMIYARYWLNSKAQFYIFGGISIILGYVPHIGLGVLNFFHTKKIDFFSLFIVLLFTFAFTFGKKYVLKIDKAIKNWAIKADAKF